LLSQKFDNKALLLMSSGNYNGLGFGGGEILNSIEIVGIHIISFLVSFHCF